MTATSTLRGMEAGAAVISAGRLDDRPTVRPPWASLSI